MPAPRSSANQLLVSLAVAACLAGCGDDTSAGSGGGGGSGDGGGATQTVASSGSTSATSATTTATGSASSTTSSSSGAGGGGGGEEFIPTPETIDFAPLGPLPAGEQILFNDWNAFPNTLSTMQPDGSAAAPVFEAYRIWSLGVSGDAATIAFASGDPEQEEHYGLSLGDAIQHTFLYDVATEGASVLTWGNINDECHIFSQDGSHLYLCRRYDFRLEGDTYLNEGYRVGRVDLASGDFEFLHDEGALLVLGPQPDSVEAAALVHVITPPNEHSIGTLDLDGGFIGEIRTEAGFPVRSPDGSRYLFANYEDQGSLWASDGNGSNEVLVVDAQASNARWSPDGLSVAYLIWDGENACSHVEVVAADGSQAGSPTRIRDCADTGEFITDLAWIDR